MVARQSRVHDRPGGRGTGTTGEGGWEGHSSAPGTTHQGRSVPARAGANQSRNQTCCPALPRGVPTPSPPLPGQVKSGVSSVGGRRGGEAGSKAGVPSGGPRRDSWGSVRRTRFCSSCQLYCPPRGGPDPPRRPGCEGLRAAGGRPCLTAHVNDTVAHTVLLTLS